MDLAPWAVPMGLVVVALITLAARKMSGGGIKTTEATDLWTTMMSEQGALRAQVARLESKLDAAVELIASLRDELRKRPL